MGRIHSGIGAGEDEIANIFGDIDVGHFVKNPVGGRSGKKPVARNDEIALPLAGHVDDRQKPVVAGDVGVDEIDGAGSGLSAAGADAG